MNLFLYYLKMKLNDVLCLTIPYISKVSKIDCLRFVMCQLLVAVLIALFSSFFAAVINSTNEANKAGGTHL
jgi:hypothetical protein